MRTVKIVFICLMIWNLGVALSYSAEMKTFPIGALFPMTGPQAYYGKVMNRGAQLAIDHVNSAGGVEGYQFKLSITDFQNVDVALALTGVQKMIVTKKIPCLLTSFSAISLGVQPICENARILMINGGGYSPKLVNKPYLHTIRLSQAQMVPPMLRYLWEMNVRKLGLIYMTNPGEATVREVINPLWDKMGGIIAAEENHPSGLTDYSSQLAKIKDVQPDAVYAISTGQDQAYLIKGAREMGITVPICITDWSDDFQHIAGKTSENVYFPVDYFDPERAEPLTQKFVDAYKAKWNDPPDLYAANYYDAVYNILSELVRRVAKSGGNPLDGAELENAVWNAPAFDTVYGGKITLNRDGSSLKTLAIFKIADGKSVVEKQMMPE